MPGQGSSEQPPAFGQLLALCGLRDAGLLASQALLALLQAALPVLGMFAMQWFIDAVVTGLRPDVESAVAWSAIVRAVAVAAGVAMLGAIVRGVAAVITEQLGRRLGDRLVQHVQAHAAAVPLVLYDEPGFHDLLHRALAEAGQRPIRLVQDLGSAVTALLGLGFVALILAQVEPWLPLATALAAWPIHRASRRHARLRFEFQRDHVVPQRAVGYLGGVLTGRATAAEVRQAGVRAWLLGDLAALRLGLRSALRRLAVLRARDELLVHVLASAAVFGAYLYLGHVALLGGLTIGGLVLQAQAVQRTQNAVRDGLGALAALGEDRLFAAPLARFLAVPTTVPSPPPAASSGGVAIALHEVGFSYPGSGAPALHAVSCDLAVGELVAVVGPNGGGKSTLLLLLAGLHEPSHGTRTCSVGAASTFLSPQHANVLERSVRDNVAFGRPLTDDAVRTALASVDLTDLVQALPLGLATMVSRRVDGGVAWSGGQLRRLLLARALAGDEALLLLDEPFAQLDAAAADRLAETLRTRRGRQTIVVADHDPRLLRIADRIFAIEAGRMVPRPPHR